MLDTTLDRPTSTRIERWVAKAPRIALATGVVASIVVSLTFAKGGWFGVDAYAYFADRGGLPGDHTSLWAPYGGHWEPVIISLYLVIWWMFGFSAYLPYVVPAVTVHAATCVLLYMLLRRLHFGPWVALTPVWLLLFYGAGSEAFITDAPVALTSAMACGLGALVILTGGASRRRTIAATALLLVALGCSMTSLIALLLVGCVLLGLGRAREAAVIVGLPLGVFVVWFAVWGRHGGRAAFDFQAFLDSPSAVWSALAVPLEDVSAVPGAGVPLLLALVLASFVSSIALPAQRIVAWAGLLAAAAQLSLSSLANASQVASGRELADLLSVGRYRYVVLLCLAPAAALALQWLAARFREAGGGAPRWMWGLLAAVLLAASMVHGISDFRRGQHFNDAVGKQYKDVLFGSVAALSVGERMLNHSGPVFMDGHHIEKLASPEARDHFTFGFQPTPSQRLTAEATLFVGVRETTMQLAGPDGLTSTDFTRELVDKPGCRGYDATTTSPLITMTSFEGSQIAVTSESSVIRTRLRRENLESEPKEWRVTPGKPVYIATSAQLAQLDIAFDNGGRFTICRA